MKQMRAKVNVHEECVEVPIKMNSETVQIAAA